MNISVIVPFFNSAQTLSLCVDSIVAQLDGHDELILVDDASTDESSLRGAYYKATHLVNHSNQGPASARNEGAFVARHEILVFVDSDVVLKGNEFEQVRKYFEAHPDCHALTGTLDITEGSHNFFTDYKNIYMNYIFSKCQREVNFIYGSFCAIRKEAFMPWPSKPRLGEDSHWGYLLVQEGFRIHLLRDICVTHLKVYNFKSLTINDYKISKNFTYLFLKYKRWNTLYTDEKFGHTTKHQKLSLVIASLTLLSVFNSFLASLSLLVFWFILNRDFLFFIKKKRSHIFFLKATAWTFFDHLIYSVGILRGLITYVRMK